MSPIIEKHLGQCITSDDGSIAYVPRGYDERMGQMGTLTVVIWSDLEGHSFYKTRERDTEPQFAVMHVGFYRPLDPKAQFLDWRLIQSTKIQIKDPQIPIEQQIEDFFDRALRPRKYTPHPEGSLMENVKKIQERLKGK